MPAPAQVVSKPRKAALRKARARLSEQGLSVAEFARLHELDRHTVSEVLSGVRIGLRGQAHNAAVLLGLKKGVVRRIEKKGPK